MRRTLRFTQGPKHSRSILKRNTTKGSSRSSRTSIRMPTVGPILPSGRRRPADVPGPIRSADQPRSRFPANDKEHMEVGSPISLPLVPELFLKETFLSPTPPRMMAAVQTSKTVVLLVHAFFARPLAWFRGLGPRPFVASSDPV